MSANDQSSVPEEHTQLLARAASGGERGAFGPLFQRVEPALAAWVGARIPATRRGHLLPEDVLAEVWVRALERFETYDPEVPFRAWIFRVAKNVMLEAWRALDDARLRGAGGQSARAFDPARWPAQVTSLTRRVASADVVTAFQRQLESLPEDDRELVLRCGLEGARVVDVAPQLGLTPQAAHKRWQRLRRQLRESGLSRVLTGEDGSPRP